MIHVFDATPLIGTAWINAALHQSVTARPINQPAHGPGALDDQPLTYNVLTARQCASVIHQAYHQLRPIIRQLTGQDVTCSTTEHAVNVNVLHPGGAYQLHTDSEPWSLLLFPHDASLPDGGALRLWPAPAQPLDVHPRRGQAVLFNGHATPHQVLQTHTRRVTVPLLYPLTNTPTDPALTHYLYGPQEAP